MKFSCVLSCFVQFGAEENKCTQWISYFQLGYFLLVAEYYCHNSDHRLSGRRARSSLEPGHSRARYFPRDMLLLMTTARETAWRLLKISSSLNWLILWVSPDSWGFPMASAASQAYTVYRRSLAYIEQMSFRLRNSNSRMARTSLIDCEGLESEKKKAC